MSAPRVTPTYIQALIASTEYMYSGVLTICILTLENGTKVTGESACVSVENYNKAMGEKIAYENAFDKVWPLEGYLLKQKMYELEKEKVAQARFLQATARS